MHIFLKTTALALGALALAACEEASEEFAFDTTYTSFADIDAALSGQTTALVDQNGTLVNSGNIATEMDFGATATGTVAYNGAVIATETGTTDKIIGQLQLNVAFDTNTLSGKAGNFIHSADGAYVGNLVGNGVFDRTVTGQDNHFDMSLTGALSNGGNAYQGELALQGNFLNGTDPIEAIAGDADLNLGDGAPAYDEGAFAALR